VVALDSLFRAYDIRGIFNRDLTEEFAEKLGSAFGEFLGKGKEVVVTRDVRLSGELLRKALVSGLRRNCNVLDVGITSTPILFYAINRLKKDAGVMITASHNPKEWNGFKLFDLTGAIHGRDLEQIKKKMEKAALSGKKSLGRLDQYGNIIEDYIQYVLSKTKVRRKLNLVIDSSNGSCGLIAPNLFKRLGCNVTVLNGEPDGNFPGHGPEPKEETLSDLKKIVAETKADFGVGFDGDGDRAVFVDDTGSIIPGDVALMIFAQDVLEKNPGAKIVFEVSCSMAVEELIRKLGGIPIIERVGHTFIMQRMVSENAVLGGEKSSHFYFRELRGMDDAVYACAKMAEILSRSGEKMSQMVAGLPSYPSIYEENVECPDNLKFAIVDAVMEDFSNADFEVNDLDGVKVIDKDGWVLLRASNTQPLIRISAEARNKTKLSELYNLALSKLRNAMEECKVASSGLGRGQR